MKYSDGSLQITGAIMSLSNYSLRLKGAEFLPLFIGGMGVDISTPELALEACRVGAAGHISDAMNLHVSDKRYGTRYSSAKSNRYRESLNSSDKSSVKFDLSTIYAAQTLHVERTINKKKGPGLILINAMEKLSMGGPAETLSVRLNAALDAGIDGITLSAGLHTSSLSMIKDHPRFRDALIGVIVSSDRALKIFLRSAQKLSRFPDYIIVEGPLAGGHLGFGEDWRNYELNSIVKDILALLERDNLNIPVIAAGGVFTGTDAEAFVKLGAAGVQVATRFTVSKESGLPLSVKQKYLSAQSEDIVVNNLSPTGYLMRMLKSSPCIASNVKPACEAFGYMLSREGKCAYIDAYEATPVDSSGKKEKVKDKMCLCYHFSAYNCYTCGSTAGRLKETTNVKSDGSYQLPTAAHILHDYLYSENHEILLPEPE